MSSHTSYIADACSVYICLSSQSSLFHTRRNYFSFFSLPIFFFPISRIWNSFMWKKRLKYIFTFGKINLRNVVNMKCWQVKIRSCYSVVGNPSNEGGGTVLHVCVGEGGRECRFTGRCVLAKGEGELKKILFHFNWPCSQYQQNHFYSNTGIFEVPT